MKSKSMGKRMQSGKKLKVAALLSSLLFGAITHAGPLSQSDLEMLDKSRQIQIEASKNRDEIKEMFYNKQKVEQHGQAGEQIFGEASSYVDQLFQKHKPAVENEKELFFVLVDLNIPETQLRSIIEETSKHNSIMVFKGIRKEDRHTGSALDKTMRLMQGIAKDYEGARVIIDPNKFEEFNVTEVPVYLHYKGDDLTVSKGSVSPDWFFEEMEKNPDKKDFGIQGKLWESTDVSIVEIMKERAAKVDWDSKMKQVKNRFWKLQDRFIALDRATEDKEYLVDPTVTATQDIEMPGQKGFLLREGESINPLEVVPMSYELYVFDASDEQQLDMARKFHKNHDSNKRLVMLITGLDTEDGWESYNKLVRDFRQGIYLLSHDIQSRVKLKCVPALISQEGLKFKINEYKVN